MLEVGERGLIMKLDLYTLGTSLGLDNTENVFKTIGTNITNSVLWGEGKIHWLNGLIYIKQNKAIL